MRPIDDIQNALGLKKPEESKSADPLDDWKARQEAETKEGNNAPQQEAEQEAEVANVESITEEIQPQATKPEVKEGTEVSESQKEKPRRGRPRKNPETEPQKTPTPAASQPQAQNDSTPPLDGVLSPYRMWLNTHPIQEATDVVIFTKEDGSKLIMLLDAIGRVSMNSSIYLRAELVKKIYDAKFESK